MGPVGWNAVANAPGPRAIRARVHQRDARLGEPPSRQVGAEAAVRLAAGEQRRDGLMGRGVSAADRVRAAQFL
jgi:hypothetical protein